MNLSSRKINLWLTVASVMLFATAISYTVIKAQTVSGNVSNIEQQKVEAETEIEEARTQLDVNEKKVTENLAALRKIDDDIDHSQSEIETFKGQLENINENIFTLETDISREEDDLQYLRNEYLKAVKKIRVARKRNSTIAFIFSSKSLNEVRRKLRYLREFSDWRDNRTKEIAGKLLRLAEQRELLAQAHSDAAVALQREENAKDKLAIQKTQKQATVKQLEADSEALKQKIARREAEIRNLGNQISILIAEEQAKEQAREEARREEERRLAQEKAKKAEEDRIAQEKARKAEQERLAQEKAKKAEEERLAQEKARKAEKDKKAQEKAKKAEEERLAQEKARKAEEERQAQEKAKQAEEERLLALETSSKKEAGSDTPDFSEASRRRERKPAVESTGSEETEAAAIGGSRFEDMKGRLPRPVSGAFKIVSAFGKHPISPELPHIMEENLGIDVHVAKDATVKAVFDGEIIKVYDRTTIPGFRNIIVVKHGEYITVYANIETLSVRSGQSVKQGDILGHVGTDFDDPSYGLIHFELWKNQTRLDPAAWIQ